jgi:hypothetical protein
VLGCDDPTKTASIAGSKIRMKLAPYSTIVICLGQALQQNQNMTVSLVNRVERAYRIATGLDDVLGTPLSAVVFSGGDAVGCGVTEASAMLAHFQALGAQSGSVEGKQSTGDSVPALVLEEQSRNTLQNALYSLPLLAQYSSSARTVLLVTSEFHMPRARLMFQCVANHSLGTPTPAAPAPTSAPTSAIPAPSTPPTPGFGAAAGGDAGATEVVEVAGAGVGVGVEIVCCPTHSASCPLAFRERLDCEVCAVGGLNEYLQKYGLGPIPQPQIAQALEELGAMYTFTSCDPSPAA